MCSSQVVELVVDLFMDLVVELDSSWFCQVTEGGGKSLQRRGWG